MLTALGVVTVEAEDDAADEALRDELRAPAAEVRALRQELGAARGGVTPAG
jgi:hypothetical protein